MGPGGEQTPEDKTQDDTTPGADTDKDTDITDEDTSEMKHDSPPAHGISMATLRYRWSKTVPTSSSEVSFVRSDRENEPTKLTWTQASDCFYSSEMSSECGSFSGKLVIDDKDYPVEDLLIKHYTFEADLFIREDIIEDEVGINETLMEDEKEHPDPSLNAIDTYQDINTNLATYPKMDSIHVSNKYEELVRQQISDKMTDEVAPKEKSGRRTPIGDISVEPFYDKSQTATSTESLHGSLGQALQLDEILNPVTDISDHMTQNIELENEVNAFFDDDLNKMPSSDLLQEGRVDTMADVFGSEGRRTPLRATDPMSEVIGDVVETRHSPQNDIVGDILESGVRQPTPAQSDHSGSVHSSARQTPQQSPSSSHSSVRNTPHKDFICDTFNSSQEKLYAPDKHRFSGSDHSGSLSNGEYRYADNMEDRPLSLSSEQELTQYFEQGSRGISDQKGDQTQMPVVGSLLYPVTMQTFHSTERPSSTTSLPVITTRQRLQAEKRSMTPDNHIRVPITASPLLRRTGESSSYVRPASTSSRASSRTITPVAADVVLGNGYREDNAHRLQDLEDTVTNLRKLLSARELEVHELKDQMNDVRQINETLRTELDQIPNVKVETSRIGGNQELESKYSLALNEKDILAAEVVRLQDELRNLQSGPSSRERRLSGRSDDSPPLNSYNPNSPTALQRKIDDLESHIQDLQEANESAVVSLSNAERRIQEIYAEKQSLVNEEAKRQQAEEENTRLREQVLDLKKRKNYSHNDSEQRKEIELQQLHEDYRGLRDRNFQLHESNMKLKEEMRELRRALERATRIDAQYRDDTRSKTPELRTRKEREHSHDSSYHMERMRDRTKISGVVSSPREIQHGHDRSNYSAKLSADNIARLERKSRERDFTEAIALGSDIPKFQRSVPDGSNDEIERKVDINNRHYDRMGTPDRKRYEQSMTATSVQSRINLDHPVVSPGRNRYDPVPYVPNRSTAYDRKYDSYTPLERSYDYSIQDQKLHSSPKTSNTKLLEQSRSTYTSSLSRSKSEKMGLDRISPVEAHTMESRRRRMSADRPRQSVHSPHLRPDKLPSTPSLDRSRERRDSASSEKSDSTLVLMSGYNRLPPMPLKHRIYQDSDEERGKHRIYKDSDDERVKHRIYQEADDDRAYPSYESTHTISDDMEDNSDTATDILVNARVSPVETAKTHAPTRLYRRDSIGSASELSVSSYSDIDEQMIANMRKRSKSADGREFIGRRPPAGSLDQTSLRSMTPKSMPTSPSGFRSIMPRPLATQHNMGSLSASCGSLRSLTQGMKPFAPRTPGDIEISDVVKFSRQGGKLSQGTVKFIGHLPGRSDVYLGVQLDKDDGKHDGTFEGIRYFKCKPNKGVFVAFNKVVMAWSPY